MEHNLKTQNFKLNINIKVYEEDIKCYNNSIMDIFIESYNFFGFKSMEINAKELAIFSRDINNIYNNLSGKTTLKEAYGNDYISFEGNGAGYIFVKGKIENSNNVSIKQTLKFENYFDQTYFKDFCFQMYNNYKKYI